MTSNSLVTHHEVMKQLTQHIMHLDYNERVPNVIGSNPVYIMITDKNTLQ